jgi:peptidylprolyl isomerase
MHKSHFSVSRKLSAFASTALLLLLTGCSNDETKGPTSHGPSLFPSTIRSPNLFLKGNPDEAKGYVRELDPYAKPKEPGKWVTTPSGLKYQDIDVGWGMSPTAGKMVMVHYTGFLSDGTEFERSLSKGMPFTFDYKSGKVIKGFDEAVETMKVGGKRRVIIPPELAYGSAGHGKKIPPNETLTYEIQLLSCDR